MAALSTGTLTWRLDDLARVLQITPADVREYFTDGRRVSFLIERRLAREVVAGGKLATSEGASFDLMDAVGRKWEVRSISSGGIYFCPSYMVGSGRAFIEAGFLQKLADIELFPAVPFWVIPKSLVEAWYRSGRLGAGTKISRARALSLLRDWQP